MPGGPSHRARSQGRKTLTGRSRPDVSLGETRGGGALYLAVRARGTAGSGNRMGLAAVTSHQYGATLLGPRPNPVAGAGFEPATFGL